MEEMCLPRIVNKEMKQKIEYKNNSLALPYKAPLND